jgi:2-iminobutanoate/2-iminopropanoate deaminase
MDSSKCLFGAGLCGTSKLVFTSGILGARGTVAESTKEALAHSLEMLQAKGFSLTDIVKARVFLKSMGDFGAFNEAYAAFFGNHKPARECVQVAALPGDAHLQVSLIASAEPKNVVLSQEAPAPIGPYVQAYMAGSRLYLSGQISSPEQGIEGQAQAVLRQLEAVLKSAGMGMADVVKANGYLDNFGDFGAMNQVYGTFFPQSPPAREVVEMAMLPKGVGVEISLIAEHGAAQSKRIISAPGLPDPVGPYSHAVEINGTVFTAGQICKEGTLEEQAATVLGNLKKVFAAAGTSPTDAVAATVFLSDLGNLGKIEGPLSDFFGPSLPVIEVVQPAKLPFGVEVEISCIAVKG